MLADRYVTCDILMILLLITLMHVEEISVLFIFSQRSRRHDCIRTLEIVFVFFLFSFCRASFGSEHIPRQMFTAH